MSDFRPDFSDRCVYTGVKQRLFHKYEQNLLWMHFYPVCFEMYLFTLLLE